MQQAEKLRNEALGQTLVQNMQRRGFDAYYCADKEAALAKALELIPETDVVSWGGSVTLAEAGCCYRRTEQGSWLSGRSDGQSTQRGSAD